MQVRFLADSRHGDWKKWELAEIEKQLVSVPLNQNNIFVLRLEDGRKVWATEKDFEFYDQLRLF